MRMSVKQLVYLAVMTALVAVATLFLHVPIPMTQGYCNLGDGLILCGGALLGPLAVIPGALGSALADLILGYGLYVPATAIIKGLMGLMAGTLCLKAEKVWQRIVWMAVAEAWMVAGYFLFETCLYGAATAAASLLGNAFQGVAGLVCGAVLWPLMGRVRKTLG